MGGYDLQQEIKKHVMCFYQVIETRNKKCCGNMTELIDELFRVLPNLENCNEKKKTTCLLLSLKCALSLLMPSLLQQLTLVDVFLPSYRNAILNQSVHVFSLGFFLIIV